MSPQIQFSMKVLQVTNAYPIPSHPIYGVFVKEQIESINAVPGFSSDTYFINAREKGKAEYLRAAMDLRRKLNDYDVIHCHHIFSAIVALAAKSSGNKILVSFLSTGINELNFRYTIPFASSLYKWVVRKSDARIFKFGIPKELTGDKRSYYIPNGVNMELFKPMDKAEAKRALGLDFNKRYVLFVSSNHLERPEKRYDRFKAAVEILRSKYNMSDIEPLTIVNEKREKVPLFFNAASLHLLCSDVEGSPNSVKESLSCNTPVVSTDVGNVRDLLGGVPSCFISPTGSPEELAELSHQALMSMSTYEVRNKIIELKLDLESVARKIVAIYHDICNGNQSIKAS